MCVVHVVVVVVYVNLFVDVHVYSFDIVVIAELVSHKIYCYTCISVGE